MKTNKQNCTVHFLPARAGDCFVLEFENKNCILIDCGYSITYREELKPLLQKLAQKGCRISLMIITHVDEDNIYPVSSAVSDAPVCRRNILFSPRRNQEQMEL